MLGTGEARPVLETFLKPAHFNNDQQDAQQDKFTNKKANVLKS